MAEARDQQLGHTKVDLRIHFPAVIPRFVAPAATGRHDVSSACTSLYTKRRDRLAPRLPGRLHAPDGAGGNPEQYPASGARHARAPSPATGPGHRTAPVRDRRPGNGEIGKASGREKVGSEVSIS